jgi:antitoxin component of MazEF toxin-antitoxin module
MSHSPVEVEIMSTHMKADVSGAVTIPAELCRAAGIAAGGEVVAEVQDGQIVLQRVRRPIWEEILDLVKDIPPKEFDKLPSDGASQHDHYIYGTPKRPE